MSDPSKKRLRIVRANAGDPAGPGPPPRPGLDPATGHERRVLRRDVEGDALDKTRQQAEATRKATAAELEFAKAIERRAKAYADGERLARIAGPTRLSVAAETSGLARYLAQEDERRQRWAGSRYAAGGERYAAGERGRTGSPPSRLGEFGSGVGRGMSSLGPMGHLASLATPAGVGAAAVYGARAASEFAVRSGEIDANPWLTDTQKRYQRATEAPLAGSMLRWMGGLARTQLTDRERELQRAQRDHQERMAALGPRAGFLRLQTGLENDYAVARGRAATFRGLHLDRPAGYDRGMALGQRMYEEDARTLDARHALRVATTERLAAERKVTEKAHLADRLADHENRIRAAAVKARDQRLRVERDFAGHRADSPLGFAQLVVGGYRERMTGALQHEKELLTKLGEVQQEREKAERGRLAANRELAQARSAERQAQVGITEAGYSILQGREMTAAGQAERLAAMGPLGRAQGMMALSMVRSMPGGIGDLPPELQQMAAAITPDEIRKLREQDGQQYVPDMRALGPAEYRDDLPSIRRQVDQAREQVIGGRQGDLRQSPKDVVAAFDDRLVDVVEQAIQGVSTRPAVSALKEIVQGLVERAVDELRTEMYVRAMNGGL